jgi:thiamine-phosphate pyrophosphorylase
MRHGQPTFPRIWLVSDARNDFAMESALRALPRHSGLIFRHYHLPPRERRARFEVLRRLAHQLGHRVALAGSAAQARRWRADAAYGSARMLARGPAIVRLVTIHSLRELAQAGRAHAVVLSPVFPTRSHPGGRVLGPLRFRTIAAHSNRPVIALGGMDRRRAMRIGAPQWAAIDGLCGKAIGPIPKDS